MTKIAQAFLLMPMAPSYESVRQTVVNVLHKLDFETARFDEEIQVGARWANAITDAIQKADLVVADVSDRNPNVMYELGYAHALRKPTLLLLSTESAGELPVDLAGYQMLTYDPKQLGGLRDQICKFAVYLTRRWSEES